nr:PQQ-binding-like beta-propeller repeat protein [Actinomycetales bacterium]
MARYIAGSAVAAVAALALGTSVWVNLAPTAGELPDLVAPTGHAEYLSGTQDGTFETARYEGFVALIGAPPSFWEVANELAAAAPESEPVVVERLSGESRSERLLVNTPEGLVTLAETWDEFGFAYPEGRLDLPSREPASWSQTGTVSVSMGATSASGEYTFEASRTAEADGCYRTAFEQRMLVNEVPVDRQWEEVRCPGRGVTELIDEELALTSTTEPTALPGLVTVDGTPEGAPAGGMRDGTPAGGIPSVTAVPLPLELPVVGVAAPYDAGQDLAFVASTVSQNNVIGVRLGDDGVPSVAWTGHPGGFVASLAVFGEVAVALTSQKEAVAYDSAGRRLWAYDTREMCAVPPVRVDDSTIALACLDGGVTALHLESGQELWRHVMPVEIRIRPAVSEGTLVAATTSGELMAVRDGEVVWRDEVDTEPTGLVAVEGGVALTRVVGRELVVYAAEDGLPSSTPLHLYAEASALAGEAVGVGPNGVEGGPVRGYRGNVVNHVPLREGLLLFSGRSIVWAERHGSESIHSFPEEFMFEPVWTVTGGTVLLRSTEGIWIVR